jgi:lycopene beta-cyclase
VSKNYDIAIVGGGNAGLNLAKRLTQSNAPNKIIVIEPIAAINKQANWCSWHNEESLKKNSSSIKGIWDKWRIIDQNNVIEHSSLHYKYACIDAAKYLSEIENFLIARDVEILRDKVQLISAKDNKKEIICESTTINATHVYDSRPPEIKENSLKQHFYGIEIELESGVKNHESVTLMDFRADQRSGLHFIYALPFNDSRIFVESTVISENIKPKSWYKKMIIQWLENQNLTYKTIISEENGVISQVLQDNRHAKIHQIGSRGGATRLASGYAFHNINNQIKLLSENIDANNYNVPDVMSNFLINMDLIFNRALINNPSLSVDLFIKMARSLSGDQFSEFMLNKANFKIWCKVIMRMPKTPFLKESIKIFLD